MVIAPIACLKNKLFWDSAKREGRMQKEWAMAWTKDYKLNPYQSRQQMFIGQFYTQYNIQYTIILCYA